MGAGTMMNSSYYRSKVSSYAPTKKAPERDAIFLAVFNGNKPDKLRKIQYPEKAEIKNPRPISPVKVQAAVRQQIVFA